MKPSQNWILGSEHRLNMQAQAEHEQAQAEHEQISKDFNFQGSEPEIAAFVQEFHKDTHTNLCKI